MRKKAISVEDERQRDSVLRMHNSVARTESRLLNFMMFLDSCAPCCIIWIDELDEVPANGVGAESAPIGGPEKKEDAQ